MPVDRDLQRHHGSRNRIADFRPRPAIDHAGRQMQQQIDQPRRLIAAEQVAKQFVLLRPDAGKARDRRKQRIEQSRAHRKPKTVPARHARLFAGHPRVFCERDWGGHFSQRPSSRPPSRDP